MVPWHVLIRLPRKYPVLRGMISYGIMWPFCSLAQEYIEFGVKFSEANWPRAARFGFFGAFFMAPVFYGWMKFTQPLFPKRTLLTCVERAALEQVSYTPFALCYFLFGMSLMELKTFDEAVEDVKKNFWRTYTVGLVFWPAAQTINYCCIPENNRIVFVSICSFVWTVFMAHVVCDRQKIVPCKENAEKKTRNGMEGKKEETKPNE
ncbi:hypothetical protein O0L34_g14514 [Tuta absoluta]|nr:hypothetical protein O0L34_g14514 [Tuta absoluta]